MESPTNDERVDLQNTLVHEAGHMLGLAHSSNDEATMYGSASTGSIEKRSLERDDIEGICAIYPKASSPTRCDDPEDFEPPPSDAGTPDAGRAGDATGKPAPRGDVGGDTGRPRLRDDDSDDDDDDERGCRCSSSGRVDAPPLAWAMGLVLLGGAWWRRRHATSSKSSP